MRRALALALLALAIASLATQPGCTTKVTPAGPGPIGTPVTPDSIQVIFTNNCAFSGCHGQPGPHSGLDLEPGASYDHLVGANSVSCTGLQRVKPFDPTNSCLIQRLTGAVTPQMPLAAGPLEDTTIAKITNWIQQGAPPTYMPAAIARPRDRLARR